MVWLGGTGEPRTITESCVMYVVETWWWPRGGMAGGPGPGRTGSGEPHTVTTLAGPGQAGAGEAPGPPPGSHSLPMERCRLPLLETPLLDWTESVLRHLDFLVFRWARSFPGMVGCWFQLSRL